MGRKKAVSHERGRLNESLFHPVRKRLALEVLVRLALKVGRLVLVDDVALGALVHGGAEFGEGFLSSLFVAGFSGCDGLLAKGLHTTGERLVTCGAGLGLTDTLES